MLVNEQNSRSFKFIASVILFFSTCAIFQHAHASLEEHARDDSGRETKRRRMNSEENMPSNILALYPTHRLRISLQTGSQDAIDILKHCIIRVTNNNVQEFSLAQCALSINDRIELTTSCKLDFAHPLSMEFIGDGPYIGQSGKVLTTQHHPSMPLKNKDGLFLKAVRINVDLRAQTNTTPTFLRGAARYKYDTDAPQPPAITPGKISFKHSELSPAGTFENDAPLLRDIQNSCSFACALDGSRVAKYAIEEELSDRTIYIICKYIKSSRNKYRQDYEDEEKLMNFFIHHHVIDHSKTTAYRNFFG